MRLTRQRIEETSPLSRPALARALRWTRFGMMAEALWRAFWPLAAVLLVGLGALMLGLHDSAAVEIVWAMAVLAALMVVVTGVSGAMSLHWPSRAEAITRLDATLPGRPIRALLDDQATTGDDPATRAVWQAHQNRMAARAEAAEHVPPDLSLSRRDPFALRYAAALVFVVALIFGSLWRVASVTDLAPGGASTAIAGASWEGWVEPPRYTGRPTLYLNDIDGPVLDIPEGSQITLRFYGQPGDLTLAETISGRVGELPSASDPAQDFTATRPGELRIDGPGGQSWTVNIIPDTAPQITPTGEPEAEPFGPMSLSYEATDDYGVAQGRVIIALDLDAVDRRHGLSVAPDPRPEIMADLPLPISGDRAEFTEIFREDFSQHPWVHLPVTFLFIAEDARAQEGASEPLAATLPGRRFFDPTAAAVIEQRRDLLWSRANAPRVAQVLRAVSHAPKGFFRSETAYLRLRVILRRLETLSRHGLTEPQQAEIAQALWDLAVLLEEGDIGDALERMRAAQERLSEAMRNGASDQEIAQLMQELREATDDYLRQLSQQAQQDQRNPQQGGDQSEMQMTMNDLQRMMERIQELMEQGRFAEAQQALEEFQQMMENLRITQNSNGQNGETPGQQAMEGLAETLREQQGLSDDAFRELQEQFNPNAQTGESAQNEGRNGGQGRGQSHEGQGQPGQGQGDGDTGQAQNGGNSDTTQPGEGQGLPQGLADRQQALRDELSRQRNSLPGAGTPGGDAARDALERAERAMDDAENALRQDDFAGAIDDQSRAMDALRDGMQELGEQMAREQQGQPGQGSQSGAIQPGQNDPLGRSPSRGGTPDGQGTIPGESYDRAQELLQDIQRRWRELGRPPAELDYLERLLDRF